MNKLKKKEMLNRRSGEKMKIRVVGGGWYGCHIAQSMAERGHEVRLFEKNRDIFSEASSNNQNRLHLGFHYPRCEKTREQSRRGFRLFKRKYPSLLIEPDLNLYAVANGESILDYGTYKQIMSASGLDYEEVSKSLPFVVDNVQGVIDCGELVIDWVAAKKYFSERLKGQIEYCSSVDVRQCKEWAKGGDMVIDCTWNKLARDSDFVYEPALMMRYKNKSELRFGLTIMDGRLCSLFPYSNSETTLSDVELTPLGVYEDFDEAYECIRDGLQGSFQERRRDMERKMQIYLPDFNRLFGDPSISIAMKTKRRHNKTDSRYSFMKTWKGFENIVSVHAGKIDTVFDIENELLRLIAKRVGT